VACVAIITFALHTDQLFFFFFFFFFFLEDFCVGTMEA